MNKLLWIRYDTKPRSDPDLWWQAVSRGLRDLWTGATYLVPGNMLAVVLAPLALFTPPIIGAIWWAAAQIAREENVTFAEMIQAGRRLAVPMWKWALINLFAYGVTLFNIYLYGTGQAALPFAAGETLISVLTGFWIATILWWTVYALFVTGWLVFEESTVKEALRGALVLIIRHYLFEMLMALVMAVVAALHALLFVIIFVITLALLATLSVRSVQLLNHGIPIPIPPEEQAKRYAELHRQEEEA